MGLQVLRHGSDELAAARVAHDEVSRNPAGIDADAAGGFERVEERVLQERVAGTVERIPVVGVDLGDAADDLGFQRHGMSVGGAASTASRYLSASSAAMQPVPAEVTAWR